MAVKHLGDITKINGAEIEPVDVIVGGSPCQDLSVAGNRAGLDGKRSGLFMEQIRVIKEMRDATKRTNQLIRPRYMVWENVPGAFSSNKAEDFRIVLEETAKIADETVIIPRPPKNKWTTVGCVMGNGWSIAWRVFDAQFWGVPQRRRRIALVADFGGQSAPEILFERQGVSGDITESGAEGQGVAGGVEAGVGEAGTFCLNDQGGQRMDLTEDVTNTLRAESHHPPLVFENHSQDSRYTGPLDVAQTVLSTFGTGGNNQPFVVETPKTLKIRSGCEGGGKGPLIQDDKSATLDLNGGNPACNQGGIAVVSKTVCIGAASYGVVSKGNGEAFLMDEQHMSLSCGGGQAGQGYPAVMCKSEPVVFDGANVTSKHNRQNPEPGNPCFTLHNDSRNYLVMAHGQANAEILHDQSPTLNCNHEQPIIFDGSNVTSKCNAQNPQPGDPCYTLHTDSRDYVVRQHFAVRRLTPLECERLQGFPDGWTDIIFNGKPASDTARYKALGNSIALPPWRFVLSRIYQHGARTLGSLFDGIGGFPLIWSELPGTTTAWASEIESFCIAVTMLRLCGLREVDDENSRRAGQEANA